jgi:N-acetylglucosamine-6-phosphate deacetylase
MSKRGAIRKLPSRVVLPKRVSMVENGTVVTPNKIIEGGSIVIEDGKIVDVLDKSYRTAEQAKHAGIVDAKNMVVIPGMIDIHTHGLQGGSALDGTAESILKMAFFFPQYGVTGFLPSTAAEPKQILLSTAKAIARIVESGTAPNRAEVLGINLEGPFISKVKPGAQLVDFIRDPDINEFNQIYNESSRMVKLITVAPELNGALDFIKKAKATGVTVAAGHSNATYEEMIAGIDAGITHASHTFNAMREFKHRDPGMLAAILVRDDVTAELIADNVHVHEGAMRLLIKAKGAGKLVLVSDSMPLAGLPDGKHDLMGIKVEKKNGVITLSTGQLAGSAVTLDRSLKIVVNQLGLSLLDAVKMVTLNPARIIKADDHKGSIEKGKDADIVLLNRIDLSIRATIIKGQVAYCSDS